MLESKLKQAFEEYNLKTSDGMLSKFNLFYDLLIEWNKNMNLTTITEEDEFIRKHILDSLSAISVIEKNISGKNKILDLGAGAGFPGIPLKVYQEELDIILMDALNKRVKFLNEVIEKLELKNISAIHSRAEDAAKINLRETFDIVVSRAVASLPTLLEYALPFLKTGGIFIAWKGGKAAEEAKASKNALHVLRGKILHIKQVKIPNLQEERALIIIKKEGITPSIYPRKSGTPQKKPL